MLWLYQNQGERPASIVLRAKAFATYDGPLPEDLVVPLVEVK